MGVAGRGEGSRGACEVGSSGWIIRLWLAGSTKFPSSSLSAMPWHAAITILFVTSYSSLTLIRVGEPRRGVDFGYFLGPPRHRVPSVFAFSYARQLTMRSS